MSERNRTSLIKPSLTAKIFFLTFAGFFVTSLVASLGNVIDGLVVGHTMKIEAMSASSVTAPIWFMGALYAGLLTKGCQQLCAERLGRGKVEEARDIYSLSLMIGLAVSVVYVVVVIAFAGPIINHLGLASDHESFVPCKDYLVSAIISAPAATLLMQISSAMYLEGERKRALLAVLILSASDVILDLLTVYALGGGMFSMGMSTSLSYYIGLFYLITYYRRKDVMLRPRLTRVSPKPLLTMIYRGIPMATSRFTTAWRVGFVNHMLVMAATTAGLAAFNLQTQVNYITNAFIFGLAQTVGLMCSIYYAEENRRGLKKTVLLGSLIQVVMGVIALVALNNGPVVMTIIKFYIGSREYEVRYYSAMMMILLGFSLLGQGLVVQFANYLQATKRIMMANIVYILDDIVLVIIGVWLSRTKLTPFSEGDEQLIYSTFLGLAIAQMFMVPLIPVIIAIVNHRLVFGWDALLMLPKGFGVPKDCEFVSSPSSVESAVEFSRDAYDFCISKGVDAKKAYGISLAAEELIKNTIEHGAFEKNKNIIEARIVVKTDEVILSLRDNCNKFNPKKYYNKIYDFTDKTKNIGIRMVMKLATDVSYTTALKLNNITVRMGDPA